MDSYKYLVFDAQYFLTRNFKALNRTCEELPVLDENGNKVLSEDGTEITFESMTATSDTLVKSFFQSIVKFVRDTASCRKIVLLFDRWPYHKDQIVEEYKGSRFYATQEDLEAIDRKTEPLKYAEMEEELRRNKIKQDAKYFIISNFEQIGMKVYSRKGYEADDYAMLIAKYLENDNERSAVVSIDSDWDYFVNKNVDHIKPNGTVIRYDDMIKNELTPNTNPDWNLSLYHYKAYVDSIYGSHNDLNGTLNDGVTDSIKDLITQIKSGDFHNFKDKNLVIAQLKSFDVDHYPEIDKVHQSLWYMDKGGSIMSSSEFANFTIMNALGIRLDYYDKFVTMLDKTLYS
jgi:hypothetical protein